MAARSAALKPVFVVVLVWVDMPVHSLSLGGLVPVVGEARVVRRSSASRSSVE
jgi:hypothetical protein